MTACRSPLFSRHVVQLMRGVALCVGLLSGCGGGESDPMRYRLSGKVTFDGKPVPSGIMYLEPAEVTGTELPSGSASIKNGTYDTSNGMGHGGGAYLIRIEGYDGNTSKGGPFGVPVFVPHSTTIELPQGNSSRDIDVPASAAEGLQISTDPV